MVAEPIRTCYVRSASSLCMPHICICKSVRMAHSLFLFLKFRTYRLKWIHAKCVCFSHFRLGYDFFHFFSLFLYCCAAHCRAHRISIFLCRCSVFYKFQLKQWKRREKSGESAAVHLGPIYTKSCTHTRHSRRLRRGATMIAEQCLHLVIGCECGRLRASNCTEN